MVWPSEDQRKKNKRTMPGQLGKLYGMDMTDLIAHKGIRQALFYNFLIIFFIQNPLRVFFVDLRITLICCTDRVNINIYLNFQIAE